MTQQVFADIVGISRSYLSEVENHKGKVPLELIVGVATNMPEINLNWLLTGEGDMYRQPAPIKTEVNELQELMKELTLEQQQELLNRGREMIKMTKMEMALVELRMKLS